MKTQNDFGLLGSSRNSRSVGAAPSHIRQEVNIYMYTPSEKVQTHTQKQNVERLSFALLCYALRVSVSLVSLFTYLLALLLKQKTLSITFLVVCCDLIMCAEKNPYNFYVHFGFGDLN